MRFWVISFVLLCFGAAYIAVQLAEMQPERQFEMQSLPDGIFAE